MGELMKNERVREVNLCAVLMSLCNSDAKNTVESSTYFSEIEESQDSIALICTIKTLVYTAGTTDLHVRHNKVIANDHLTFTIKSGENKKGNSKRKSHGSNVRR